MGYSASPEPNARYITKTMSVKASRATARYTEPTEEDYVSIFYTLVKRWRAQTILISSVKEIITHPDFKSILEMGKKVIPLIINEVETQPDLLITALPILTGENPVSDMDRGNIPAMAISWKEWYQNK